jgi:hypothetical protein
MQTEIRKDPYDLVAGSRDQYTGNPDALHLPGYHREGLVNQDGTDY